MWIKYKGTLYNMDDANTVTILRDRDGNFVIGLESHKAHFCTLDGMTKEEVEFAYEVICAHIENKMALVRLDEHVEDHRRGIA